VSSYRDDLEAAQARADAAEREAAALKRKLEEMQRPRIHEGPTVPIPERFKVERSANELRVWWRWFKPQHVGLLFFVIAWDAFLFFWYFGAPAGRGGLLFQIFPIGHVAVGAGLSYHVLTGFLNRTTLEVRSGQLRVSHGPLPWSGNHTLRRDDLRQLFVTRTTKKNKQGWDVRAVLDDGRELTLVSALDEKAQAEYLEDAFEQHLGIVDQRVAGEG
jgi:hypothetical protein